jgi:hypothetical protein
VVAKPHVDVLAADAGGVEDDEVGVVALEDVDRERSALL